MMSPCGEATERALYVWRQYDPNWNKTSRINITDTDLFPTVLSDVMLVA